MSLKSTPQRYGTVAAAIHWTTALAIAALLVAGFVAARAAEGDTRIGILRFHVALGLAVVLLTLFRIGWWWFADKGPGAVQGMARWRHAAAWTVHRLLYAAILVLGSSGIATLIASGAGPVLLGGNGTLPQFDVYPPKTAHWFAAWALLALLVTHVGAALEHQFIRRDGLLARMRLGR